MDIDRLAELRRTAGVGSESTGSNSRSGTNSGVQSTTNGNINGNSNGNSVASKMQQYEPIQQGIVRIQNSTAALDTLRARNARAISEKQRKSIMVELNTIIDDTNVQSMMIKRTLDRIKPAAATDDNERASAKAQIDSNMYETYIRKFHDVMINYNKAATEFKTANRSRDARILKTIDPSMTEQQAEFIVDNGAAAVAAVVQQALVSDDLTSTVREVEQRHVDLLRLEQQVIAINELFSDLATLVDLQQESLDVIENRVLHAQAFTVKAETELNEAAVAAAKARRRMMLICLCLLVLGVILAAVLAPIFTTIIKNAGY